LARGWMSVASIMARGNAAGSGFTEKQKAEYLPRIARGEFLGSFALSEPNAGSDVASLSTRAHREGDEWVINGSKMWCTFADGSDYMTVMARTDPNIDPKARH